ncbi:hypothetical protein MRX96_010182 [Rhipicephalus microplus]
MLFLLPSDRGRRSRCLFEGPGVADATWYGAGRKNVAGRSARHSRKALDAARSAINADRQPWHALNTWENNSNKRPRRMRSLLPSDRGRRSHCLFEKPRVADATWYGAGRKNVAGRSARHSRKALDAARSAINADSQPRHALNTWENNSNKRPRRMLSLLPSDRGRRSRCLFEKPGVADATWYGAGRKNVASRSARHSRKALDAARSAINADSQPWHALNTWENNSNKRPRRMLSLLPSDRGRRRRCLFEGPGVADATWYGAGRKNVAGRSARHSRKALHAERSAINADSSHGTLRTPGKTTAINVPVLSCPCCQVIEGGVAAVFLKGQGWPMPRGMVPGAKT